MSWGISMELHHGHRKSCRFVTASISSSALSTAVFEMRRSELLCCIQLPEFSLSSLHAPEPSSIQSRPRFPPQTGTQHEQHKGALPTAIKAQEMASTSLQTSLTTSTSSAAPQEAGNVCVEVSDGGLRRVYRPRGSAHDGFEIQEQGQTHQGRLRALVSSYILPSGFPDSVAPQYRYGITLDSFHTLA